MVSSFDTKLMINSMLLGAVVSMFFLVASLKSELLSENPLLAFQMVLSIPLFVSACISSSYSSSDKNSVWYNFGWLSFIFAYGFTINSIGIIISFITSISVGISFFVFSMFLSVMYSFLLVIYEGRKIKERLFKDGIFLSILFFLGVLVIVN